MRPDKAFRKSALAELKELNASYKKRFITNGVHLPLKTVPFFKGGILKHLPHVAERTGWPWNVEVDAEDFTTHSNWPQISIVIPSFNQAAFLEEAIRSVLLQNYPNLELIVMDGGSNDGSREIIQQYAPWLSYWQSKKDNGQGQAINMGFSIAGGDYFGWLNSDDFYNPRALAYLGNEVRRSSKSFYYGDAYAVNRYQSEQFYCKANPVKDMFLRFGGLIYSHSAFWKSTTHQPIWETMHCNVDGELWIRLVKGQTKQHIRFPIGTLRFYDDTKSSSEKWKAKWREDDVNIARLHGTPPAPRSPISYFYRLIQHIYQRLNKGPLKE